MIDSLRKKAGNGIQANLSLISRTTFLTKDGTPVPALTAAQMRRVDEIAMQEFEIHILQMMENAGRNLADCAIDMLKKIKPKGASAGSILILAGSGGNGGGGLCCARHLVNRGISAVVVLDHPAYKLRGAAARQLSILMKTGVPIRPANQVTEFINNSSLIIDALIGYSLSGAPRGAAENLISQCSRHNTPILSLDIPSGMDATNGSHPGVYVDPVRTLTLALPKRGLALLSGHLYLADIGIPPPLFRGIGITVPSLFCASSWIPLSVIQ
jgi:NAD(P)H-hydrate epimerase